MKRKLILFITVISLMVVSASCTQLLSGPNPSQPNLGPAPTLQPVEKILSVFTPIQGTNYLLARISADPTSRESSANPLTWIDSSYRSSGYDVYNYVFFDLDSETYHRLLPTNDTVILQIRGFPVPDYAATEPAKPPPPIEWWLYVMVKADTNKNGNLDYEDKKTLGISDVGGNGFAEVIPDVDNLLGDIYKEGSTLFVIYNSNEKNYLAKINLLTREVVTTTEMDLGEDVK
ncbi:MAG: hypothetical protein H7Y59_13185 [Anaerolineales bacterium]|nr:hypothetical protein [Anaerolineales bacterium]